MPWAGRFARYSFLLEIGLGLLLLGAATLLFLSLYPYGALALVAIVAVRNGVREGLASAVCAWGLYLARAPILRSVESFATLFFLLAGGVAFGAIGLYHRRAVRALQQRVDDLKLELADQGVRFLEAIEEKQELEQRLARERSAGPSPCPSA